MAQPNPRFWENDPIVGNEPQPAPAQRAAPRLIVPATPVATPLAPESAASAQATAAQTSAETANLPSPDEAALLRELQREQAQSQIQSNQAQVRSAAEERAARVSALTTLQGQVDRVQQLYEQGFRDTDGLAAIGQYFPSNQTRQFNSAGAGLTNPYLSAFRVPGVGSQSDAELRAFIDANQPSSWDYDDQIEEKLNNIRRAVDARRQELGLEPYQWGASVQAQAAAISAQGRPGGQGGAGPAAGGGSPRPTGPSTGPVEMAQAQVLDPNMATFAPYDPATQQFERPPVAPAGPQHVTTEGSHRFAQIDEAKLSALQQSVYDLQRGVPREQILADLESAGFNTDDASSNARALLDERDQIGLEAFRRKYPTFQLRPSDYTTPPPDISDARGQGGVGEAIDASVRGTADMASLGFADELAYAVTGSEEELRRQRAIDDYDAENHFWARTGGQVVGGFLIPAGRVRTVGQAARQGAIVGGGYGLGSGEGGLLERAPGGAAGAAIGGGVGAGIQRFLGGLANRQPRPQSEAGAAAQRQNISMMPADAGGPITRRATGIVAQTIGGVGPIMRAANRTVRQTEQARDRIAATQGMATTVEGAGETARRGAQRFISASSQRGGQLYDDAERLAGDAMIDPARARSVLDRHITELSDTPGGSPGVEALRTLRADLDGQFSVSGMRRMRTALRDAFIQNGLRGSDIERRVNQVIAAATDDVAEGLKASGRGNAANAYRLADRFWAERLRRIDEEIAPIIGKNGDATPQQIVSNLQTALRSGTNRFRGFVRDLPDEEASTLRATLIQQMGRPAPGQGSDEVTFSLSSFLTNWNQITENGANFATLRAVFGKESADALQDLARVAGASRNASRYANHSNSGAIMAGQASVPNLITGGGSYAAGGLEWLAAAVGTQWLTGRLLGSPWFARRLAGVPNSPTRQRTWIRSLGEVSRRDPAIAQEVLSLRDALLQVANDNFGSAVSRTAAESDTTGRDNR